MRQFIDVTGKTEDEAISRALEQLKLDRDDVSVEILERPRPASWVWAAVPPRFASATAKMMNSPRSSPRLWKRSGRKSPG